MQAAFFTKVEEIISITLVFIVLIRVKKGNIKMKKYYVYMLTNKKGGVLYIGATNTLLRRVSTQKSYR